MFRHATLVVMLFVATLSTAKGTRDRMEAIKGRPSGDYKRSNSTILSFDDIPTITGLATIPSPYHHLAFSSYNVISPRDPSLDGKISPHDLNCAVSAPNALIGSRDLSSTVANPVKASFQVGNATTMVEQGFFPSFDLLSFYIKPMDAPPPGSTVFVKGYSHLRREPLEWDVDFITGYHLPLLVKVQQYTGEVWNQLNKVEIWVDFGDDALDWEFCIDDLEVEFHETHELEGGYTSAEQAVLSNGEGMEFMQRCMLAVGVAGWTESTAALASTPAGIKKTTTLELLPRISLAFKESHSEVRIAAGPKGNLILLRLGL